MSSLVGVGLRTPHYPYLLSGEPVRIDWFEAISENYMDSFGRPRSILRKLRESYDFSLHGVSLNIGSTDPINIRYLDSLKLLYQEIQPIVTSDHLCWTGVNHLNGHDLFPIPYTIESIEHVVSRIQFVQDYLGRQMSFENVSTYVRFSESEMTEWEFISEIVERSGCGLMLDLNNIFVNAFNHKFDPIDFIKGLPLKEVKQMHLAGFSDEVKFYFDTHSKPVHSEVWRLFKNALEFGAKAPVILEWDEDIPEFKSLEDEALKVRDYLRREGEA
ncbi:MAG: DUF692 domain-containing protein [Bdellovibrionales bacterium]|nr:DUF692 domain-containing protein [Bdellovibrionales bacterium]